MCTSMRNHVIHILSAALVCSIPFTVTEAQEPLLPNLWSSGETRQVFVLHEAKNDELIGINWYGDFDKLDLRVNERIIKGVAKKLIAVYVTSDRYLGYGGARNTWRSINRKVAESFLDLQAGDANAVVLTNKRVLSFDGRKWTARRR